LQQGGTPKYLPRRKDCRRRKELIKEGYKLIFEGGRNSNRVGFQQPSKCPEKGASKCKKVLAPSIFKGKTQEKRRYANKKRERKQQRRKKMGD